MSITLCTHPGQCGDLQQAYANVAEQLAAALADLARARAALAQAQAAVAEWQDAYQGAVEGKAFYEGLYCDKCKEAVTR